MALRETVKIIFDIIYYLANAPNGVSRSEIVEKHKIGKSTASKYIGIIENMGVPIYVEGQRYYVDEGYFVNLRLTTEESEFLFLALERSLTYHTSQWQIVRTLIHKISTKLDPSLAGYLQGRFDVERGNLETARFFTTLAQAKKQRREVWVDYHPLNREAPSRWLVRPYRFVSNPLSDGFYVLCEGTRGEQPYLGLSLKFDRIQDVQLTNRHFELIDQARFQSHFGRAWGVWSSQRSPSRVVLRFEPRHYDRLLESIWHPSQRIHTDADGYISYTVDVSEPAEMVPWIRSWGSGVVVEEPKKLRQRVIRSLMRQVRNYDLTLGSTEQESLLHLLWAKYDRKSDAWHPLLYHLLDVAAVACCMWDEFLGMGQKAWLARLSGLDEQSARGLLALLAGLHDIGKATPAFQKKVKPLYQHIIQADTDLRERSSVDDHGILSAVILRQWLIDQGLRKPQATQLAAVIGGHHGAWVSGAQTSPKPRIGKEKWKALQNELCETLQEVLGVAEISLPESPQPFNVFAASLSGFISVCDWIGSNDGYFPYEEAMMNPQDYFQRAQEQAATALHDLGWLAWAADGRKPAFDSVFPFEANELQAAAIQHLQGFKQAPRLILVEYLTGGGKTELALHIGDLLVNRFDLAGTYIAMPTRATSNQMFERVGDYLQRRYPHDNINLRLIHGGSERRSPYPQTQAESNREGDESAPTAEDWFQNRKRALLTPYAVGTIDQAMLSVLQAKHHFVRQFGLSRKVIVFDEIHSYDTYMDTIIERLFNWLHALDSPMILLSATLSRQGRTDILKAVGASKGDEAPDVRYPRLTVVENDGAVWVHPLPLPKTRVMQIKPIPPDLNHLVNKVRSVYEQGGCIAIVCNTVNESIEVARCLREAEGIAADEVWLFHARFPPTWRNEIEQDVLNTFGKDGTDDTRPERAILVATQIIEQSLDLDFDLMVSRCAPIDLLIQRMGRLHRHPHRSRPSHLAQPTLVLRTPTTQNHVPDFGVDSLIYARFFLLKTWLCLREIQEMRIPDDMDDLMNFVYSDEIKIENISPAYGEALAAAADEMGLNDRNSAFRGTQFVIGKPSNKRLIGGYSAGLSDDEERSIATRNIRPGIDIICVMDADSHLKSLIERVPSKAEVDDLLSHKVTVSQWGVKQALEGLEENPNWARKSQLKYARVVEFDGDSFDVPDSPYTLRLTREYGLEIINQEGI